MTKTVTCRADTDRQTDTQTNRQRQTKQKDLSIFFWSFFFLIFLSMSGPTIYEVFTEFARELCWIWKFLTFQMDKVCVLPDRFFSTSERTCILSLYTILPSFIKIGQELFEIIEVNTQTHTHRHTDTYTRMKIIPVQKQSFWAR